MARRIEVGEFFVLHRTGNRIWLADKRVVCVPYTPEQAVAIGKALIEIGNNKIKEIERKPLAGEELAELRRRAKAESKVVTNLFWRRAYLRLADAADCLHAMEGRAQERVIEQPAVAGGEGD